MKQIKTLFFALTLGATATSFASPFELLVTETGTGSLSNPNDWKGIQRYGFTGTGSSASSMAGIPPSAVSDPAGMYFTGTELFVGNRHGNSSASSISRFLYDSGTGVFTANGTITGNGLLGVHGLAMRPGTSDLYASNVNTGVSIFSVTPGGSSANGTLLSGPIRDVMFSADGNNMYATTGVNGNIVRYDFTTATTTTYNVAGASGLHFGAWRNGSMFIGDFGGSGVFQVNIDGTGAITGSSSVASFGAAIGVAFSPDDQEMFVSSHTGNTVGRYLFNAGTSAWDYQSSFATGTNLGDLQVIGSVPEPATMAVLGLGAAALLRRRRKN